jgi:hypothetical protein
MVTLRVRATVRVEKPSLRVPVGKRIKGDVRRVWIEGRWREILASPRESLGTGAQAGPALITDYGSTTLVAAGWSLRQDRCGTLVLRRG